MATLPLTSIMERFGTSLVKVCLALIFSGIVFAAFAQTDPAVGSPAGLKAPSNMEASKQSPAAGPPIVNKPVSDDGYRLGTGDKVRVIVYGEEDLSGEFQVDSTGTVRLPLVGQVQAQDKTVKNFEQDIAAKFVSAGYLKNPQVSVEVLAYRPFYIIGEVNKPGEYPYHNGMNVLNAVAVAGGYTYRSNKSKVYIRPSGKTDEIEKPANGDTQIGPGDIVRIPERFF